MNGKTKTQMEEIVSVENAEEVKDISVSLYDAVRQTSEEEKALLKEIRLTVPHDAPIQSVINKKFMQMIKTVLGGRNAGDGVWLDFCGVVQYIPNDNKGAVIAIRELFHKARNTWKNGGFAQGNLPFEFSEKGKIKMRSVAIVVSYTKPKE